MFVNSVTMLISYLIPTLWIFSTKVEIRLVNLSGIPWIPSLCQAELGFCVLGRKEWEN